MGVYFIAVNHTKKELVDPHKLGCGAKLWEQFGETRSLSGALTMLLVRYSTGPLTTNWACDRVELVSDLWEDDYESYRAEYTDISAQVLDALDEYIS